MDIIGGEKGVTERAKVTTEIMRMILIYEVPSVKKKKKKMLLKYKTCAGQTRRGSTVVSRREEENNGIKLEEESQRSKNKMDSGNRN